MHNLASILQDRAKFSDALKLYLKARECKERHPSLGTNHALTMDTISCLAILYTELGMFAEALDCDQRVLNAISTKPGGEHSVLYLSTKRHLGTIYHKLGKYKEAEEHIFCAYQEQLQLTNLHCQHSLQCKPTHRSWRTSAVRQTPWSCTVRS